MAAFSGNPAFRSGLWANQAAANQQGYAAYGQLANQRANNYQAYAQGMRQLGSQKYTQGLANRDRMLGFGVTALTGLLR